MGDFISTNAPALTLVLAGLCLLGLVMLQALRVSRLKRRLDQLTGGIESGDFETVMSENFANMRQLSDELDEVAVRMAAVEGAARHHLSRQGLVRFNPFPDTGGNHSFAMALLDEAENGIVFSSLHSRTGIRLYAKAVVGGKTDSSVSAEEQQAIDEARSQRSARPSAPPRSAAALRTPAVPLPARAAPAATAAKAAPSAPAPSPRLAGARRAAPVELEGDTVVRPAAERAVQAKPKSLASPGKAGAEDSERVTSKPGLRPSRPGSR